MRSIRSILPFRSELKDNLLRLAAILGLALLLFPLVRRLPIAGYDWFFVFYGPAERLSAYPPYAHYLFNLLTWLEWRDSLAILASISLVTIAVSTWRHGGRGGSVLLALLSAPTWHLLWMGHPDGLVLLGLATGIFPLALIKPQISIWYYLKDLRWVIVIGTFLALTLLIWPLWVLNFTQATFEIPAAFGWSSVGWPMALLGLALLAGAGRDPDRLMAAGTLLSPYLLPYHLVVLIPIIGRAEGKWKIALCLSSWLMVVGVGLDQIGNLLSLAFPLLCYGSLHSFSGYRENVSRVWSSPRRAVAWFHKWRAPSDA